MPHPHRAKPSLDDARARVNRAREHIARLEAENAALPTNKNWAVTFGSGVSGKIMSTQLVPSIIAILIGETVYNLRAALDYLVYELAHLNAGDAVRTQFPIESQEASWNTHEKNWLRGVSPTHKARIKDLQPFNGIRWTAMLREMSNPDKHRHLLIAENASSVVVTANSSLESQTIGLALDKPVGMQSKIILEIFLVDGTDRTPVIGTLKMLERQVADVIDSFEHEFK